MTEAQNNYNTAIIPANNLAAEQAKIANLQRLASEYQHQANATPQQVQYDIFTVGAGYLDANAAVGVVVSNRGGSSHPSRRDGVALLPARSLP